MWCAFVLALAAAQPSAEARQKASQAFKAASAAAKSGDLERALAEFSRAYELTEDYRVLYNIGVTHERLKQPAAALTTFERYLNEGGDDVRRRRRAQLGRTMQTLREQVGVLTVEGVPADAVLSIDGEAVEAGKAYYPPKTLAVEVRQLGFEPFETTVKLAAGADVVVVVPPLEPIVAPATPNDPPLERLEPSPSDGRRVEPLSITMWTVGGVTVAAGVTTAILGGVTVGARRDFDDALVQYPGDPQDIADKRERARSLGRATDAMIGVTSVLAATTVGLVVTVLIKRRRLSSVGQAAGLGNLTIRF